MLKSIYAEIGRLAIFTLVISCCVSAAGTSAGDLKARWYFDSVEMTGDGKPVIKDVSGNDNYLRGGSPSLGGDGEIRSLELSRDEYVVDMNSSLAYADMTQDWCVDLKARIDLPGTEQVLICKEGPRGALQGDLSIGFDNSLNAFFVEVTDASAMPVRLISDVAVQPGVWYDIKAKGEYDADAGKSRLSIAVRCVSESVSWKVVTDTYEGKALDRRAGRWIIGRGYPGGFPNSLSVLKGAVADISVSGAGVPRKRGDNPIFGDRFTADPAVMIHDGVAYAYVGEDLASPGGWFNMPHWLCYTSVDMVEWEPRGVVLEAAAFPDANPYGAWAAQVVERDGKFYFYVTLDNRHNGEHMIDVAVGDSPLGPFVPARSDGTPLITDDMTPDSHRVNADIDPTVLIDDDGTPWMAWGNGDCYVVKLKRNMIELDGPVTKIPMRNMSEGPWLFKRGGVYYNVYAADAPGVQPEQIAYSTADNILGPWHYRGLVTSSAKHGFTIHPSVVEKDGAWYFFYHDGAYDLNGQPGGDCRRQVCLQRMYFNDDGSIQPVRLTSDGINTK